MLHYPPFVTKICKYCKAAVTLERQGSGGPREGRLDYWYTTDHRCPGSDRAMEAIKAERLTLEKIMAENLC